MTDICEAYELEWHTNEKHSPRHDGEYLCKCVDVVSIDEDDNVEWSEPYYAVYDYEDGLWDCDGVPVAWAEIPHCSFEI